METSEWQRVTNDAERTSPNPVTPAERGRFRGWVPVSPQPLSLCMAAATTAHKAKLVHYNATSVNLKSI